MKQTKDAHKSQIFVPSKAIIKDIYLSIKKRKRFGCFMTEYEPLQGITFKQKKGDYPMMTPLMNGIKVACNRIILMETLPEKVKALEIMLYGSEKKPYSSKLKPEYIRRCYVEDYFENYAKTHKVIPNSMAYGFKYGKIFMCIGLALTFSLMFYFFSPICSFVLIVVYFLTLSNNVDLV